MGGGKTITLASWHITEYKANEHIKLGCRSTLHTNSLMSQNIIPACLIRLGCYLIKHELHKTSKSFLGDMVPECK